MISQLIIFNYYYTIIASCTGHNIILRESLKYNTYVYVRKK